MTHILLVEDDRTIVRNLSEFLKEEGFAVRFASGQREAVALLSENTLPDLLLLDVSLSDGNGYAVCRAGKEKGIPVIFLTASGDEYSTVAGLDMGADDYISKPFRPRELVSRIKSVLRRSGKGQAVWKIGDLLVDPEKAVATKNGEIVWLSALEYRLLLILLQNRGRVMTREQLLEEIWDDACDFVGDNTLTVYIKRLREKIERDPKSPEIILTVRGMGYKIP